MRFIVATLALLSFGSTTADAAPASFARPAAEPSASILTVKADPLVLHVQRHLAAKGLYRGRLDGILGPLTRAAVRAFERANGYPVSGNPKLLAPRIGYNPPGPAGGPGAGNPRVANPPGPAGGPGAGNPPGPVGGPGAGR